MNIYTIILTYLEHGEDYDLTWRRTADTPEDALEDFLKNILPHYISIEYIVKITVREQNTGICLLAGDYDVRTKTYIETRKLTT